jgi:elongation factor G
MKLKNTDLFLLAVADYDENLLEKFMEDENSITEEEINKAFAVMDMAIIPMIAGSSLKQRSSIHVRCSM